VSERKQNAITSNMSELLVLMPSLSLPLVLSYSKDCGATFPNGLAILGVPPSEAASGVPKVHGSRPQGRLKVTG
jgi:hypothetical protein